MNYRFIFYQTTCYRDCRNGHKDAGSVEVSGLQVSQRVTHQHGRPRCYLVTSATSSLYLTYAAGFRSKARHGLGWVGKSKQVIAVQMVQVDSEDKVDEESRNGSGCSLWSWETSLAKLHLHSHSSTPPRSRLSSVHRLH